MRTTLLAILALTFLAACARDKMPFNPGSTPTDLGDIGAGEGPVWHPDGYLLFTGKGQITRRDQDGQISVYRPPEEAGAANGLFVDSQGRLVACESGNRRVTRTDDNGDLTVLAERFQGKRFNTPNDLTLDTRGRIYFTDPRYGPRETMEMVDADGKLVEGVYRIDAPGQVARILTHEVDRPNGILVSPGDQYLYVGDNNIGGASKLWRFTLKEDGSIKKGSRKRVFDWRKGRGPDGFEMDLAGNLYVTAGRSLARLPYETSDPFPGGVYVLSPKGNMLRFHPIPNDEVTNCAFGGADMKTLYVTAGGHLWRLRTIEPGYVSTSP